MAIAFTIERSNRTYKARADGGAPFLIGFQTHFTDRTTQETFEGLFNVPSNALPKLFYDKEKERPAFGFWADFIAPTAQCEGGNFLTLNTYDRAKFTWGFGQFGAHVADGDFIRFFRNMLDRPEAPDFFPDLRIKNGRITKISSGGEMPLESAQSTRPLMDFLNPTNAHIEDDEVIAAAKLIHWTMENEGARSLQTTEMVATFKRLMAESDRRLGLDGRKADVCLVICDIRHQGRATFIAMQQALAASDPRAALLKLGSISYPDRIKTLRAAIKEAEALLTSKRWSRVDQDFV